MFYSFFIIYIYIFFHIIFHIRIQFVNNKRDINEVAYHLDYNISLITTNLLYEPKVFITVDFIIVIK